MSNPLICKKSCKQAPKFEIAPTLDTERDSELNQFQLIVSDIRESMKGHWVELFMLFAILVAAYSALTIGALLFQRGWF